MVTTDSKLAQAFTGSASRSVYLAEHDLLIGKNSEGAGYTVYGGDQKVAQVDPDAGLTWLREQGYAVTEDSDWMPIEFHFAGENAETLVKVLTDDDLPLACYRFLVAQACAAEPVYAYSNEIGGIVSKYIWFMNERYTVADFGVRWQTGEIHP